MPVGTVINNIRADTVAIAVGAFSNHSNLTSITIPASVTSIGDNAFYGCRNITSITIPAGVTSIGGDAFGEWTSSQTINIQGHANQESADAAWGNGWRMYFDSFDLFYGIRNRKNIDAKIVYQGR